MPSDWVRRQIDRMLDDAAEALATFDWARVQACALTVLALARDNADASAHLAAAEQRLGTAMSTPSARGRGLRCGEEPSAL